MEKNIKEARIWFYVLFIVTIITGTYELCEAQYLAFGLILIIGFPCILHYAEEAKLINDKHPGGLPLKINKKGISKDNPFIKK